MLAGDVYLTGAAEQNHRGPFDANADHHVTPLDVLTVINAMARPESSARRVHRHVFPDVNGDGNVTVQDAFRIIDAINLRGAREWLSSLGVFSAASSAETASGEGCSGPTISGPTDVNEFQIFTVSGTAFGATSVSVQASGAAWAYVDVVGISNPVFGWQYDSETGGYSRMLIFKDDSPPGTSQDSASITITVEGDCGGSATHNLTLHNVDVTATAEASPSPINEGDWVNLEVTLTDATLDAHAIVVDWGDGHSSTVQHSDYPQLPFHEMMAFADWPGPYTATVQLSHELSDDNPTVTSVDLHAISVTVSDNDGSSTATTANVTVANTPPMIQIDEIIPLDNLSSNGQVDETEGFRVRGRVTDAGVNDSHTGWIRADLNGNGIYEAQETLSLAGSGGSWTFDKEFPIVFDDGPSPGNGTPWDDLTIQTFIQDDDSNFDVNSSAVRIHNLAPVANQDQFTVTEDDGPTLFDVLGNDFDYGNADVLEIVAIDTSFLTGEASIGPNNKIQYSPAGRFECLGEGDEQSDLLFYTVRDDDGGEATAAAYFVVAGKKENITVSYSVSGDAAEEGQVPANLNVSLSPGIPEGCTPAQLQYSHLFPQAYYSDFANADDVQNPSGGMTFGGGETLKVIEIFPVDDATAELNEKALVEVTAASTKYYAFNVVSQPSEYTIKDNEWRWVDDPAVIRPGGAGAQLPFDDGIPGEFFQGSLYYNYNLETVAQTTAPLPKANGIRARIEAISDRYVFSISGIETKSLLRIYEQYFTCDPSSGVIADYLDPATGQMPMLITGTGTNDGILSVELYVGTAIIDNSGATEHSVTVPNIGADAGVAGTFTLEFTPFGIGFTDSTGWGIKAGPFIQPSITLRCKKGPV